MSETTCTLASGKFNKKGSCGKRAIVNDIDIRDKGADGVGEIWVKGNNVFSGYLNHQNQDDFDQNGWFNTGDRGVMDEDGFLFLKGRSKNFLKASDGRFYNIEAISEKVLENTFLIQQVVTHILNTRTPIALITLGEEALDYDSALKDSQLLQKIFIECQTVSEALKRLNFTQFQKSLY